MLRFEREQSIFNIEGIKIGGQPGENPVVLIGSIFYSGHKIVKDQKRGVFDKEKAEELIQQQAEISEITGVPYIFDVVAENPEAMEKYVDFISDTTSAPFILDGIDPDTRMKALNHIVEIGVTSRTIYGQISPTTKPDELQSIKDSGIKSSIVFAFSSYDPTAEGKVALLESIDGKKGLLEIAKDAGISQPLIDTAVLDISSVAVASDAIQIVKQKYGLPSGCAPANGVSMWKKSKISKEFYRSCEASAMVFTRSRGADFILYGPIEAAKTVFPSIATYEALLAYTLKWAYGFIPNKDHPFFKMF